MANYAGHIFLGEQSLSYPTARANQSSMEWFTARAKITCSQLVFILLNDSREFSGIPCVQILDFDPETLDFHD